MKIRKSRSLTAVLAAILLTLSSVSCGKSENVGQVESDVISDSASEQTPAESSSDSVTEAPTEPVPEDKVVHVCAAGDNLIHYSVYKNAEQYALEAGEGAAYDFAPLYENVRYIIEDADVAVLNQETIISQSNEIRGANGGALLFNSPPEVADAVIDLGFDVFTMANNHLLDFGAAALEESINFWNEKAQENDLTVLGAYLSEEDANNIRIREVNGMKIAFLAYAEHINGFSLSLIHI